MKLPKLTAVCDLVDHRSWDLTLRHPIMGPQPPFRAQPHPQQLGHSLFLAVSRLSMAGNFPAANYSHDSRKYPKGKFFHSVAQLNSLDKTLWQAEPSLARLILAKFFFRSRFGLH
jgi:hypothetical protein